MAAIPKIILKNNFLAIVFGLEYFKTTPITYCCLVYQLDKIDQKISLFQVTKVHAERDIKPKGTNSFLLNHYLSTLTFHTFTKKNMNESIRSLEPKTLWNHFADLNAIPRASKREEQVIAFMIEFGESLGLDTMKDEIGNVIIRKPATPGMEDRQTVVLQSHLDMVHQKNASSDFDFDTQGIIMKQDGDWVMAEGTTLGADNGIGVSAIMSLLSSESITHPPLEALFTIDEETGMTGALELKGGLLKGDILLNLDTEDDRELTIGCAGGIDVTSKGEYEEMEFPEGYKSYMIQLGGLVGGHSGMDIHLGRGNANKMMNRILYYCTKVAGISICSIHGGGLRNAIPRESSAIIGVHSEQEAMMKSALEELAHTIKQEYHTTDPGLFLKWESIESATHIMHVDFQKQFLRALYACPNGIYRMSPDIPGLVQSSNNLAQVIADQGKFTVSCLTRSAVDSEKTDLADSIASCFYLIGANINTSGSYPGWAPKPEAPIIKLMEEIYRDMFKTEPDVNACHAGLECGILGTNYPDMDMISFGPNIRGAHSPDERVQISSVQKFWEYLLKVLVKIPSTN
jgi:dipeptidase D